MTEQHGLVVSADGHILEPTDLFKTRLPKHLRDRAVWEEDFEIEPLVEGGATVFRRLHTSGFEGWTISRYRQTGGRTPEGDPEIILEDLLGGEEVDPAQLVVVAPVAPGRALGTVHPALRHGFPLLHWPLATRRDTRLAHPRGAVVDSCTDRYTSGVTPRTQGVVT